VYIRDFATAGGERTAVVMGSGRRVTYAELDDRSLRLAGVLADLGLRRGDHFAMVMENHPAYYEVVWAGLRSGLYVTAINSHLTAEEAAYIADDCGAQVLVTSHALALGEGMVGRTPSVRHRLMVGGEADGHLAYEPLVAARSPRPVTEDQRGMVMLYSSGTTGRPKGIKFPLPPAGSPLGEWEIAEHSRLRYGFADDMVFLSPAPLDPAAALALMERERVTHSQWVPTMFVRLLKLPEAERARYDLSAHRIATHAAAPCPVAVKEQMIEWWGPIIEEYYAGTENIGSTSITSAEWLEHKGSVGRPSHGAVVHICDDQGRELPVGETGAVYFEDPSAGFEYHGDLGKTASVAHPDHPTWRTLGDIGRLDEDGYLYLTDRRAFMIVSGGVNIYPQEIEDVLVAHPKVLDVAVFGVPDDEMGEEVKAVVQPVHPGDAGAALAEELAAWCEGRLAGYKRPRSYDFVDQLPRLDNGKLYKKALRDRYWASRPTRVV
jgi:fatty-acyl-CoA synthase